MYSASCLSTLLTRCGGIEEQQHHVGPADRALGAGEAVELDVGLHAFLLAHAGRVDGEKVRPSRSKRTSTLSRVVPGTSLTMMRSLSARLLMKVLLPVLRRPTMASFTAGHIAGERRSHQPLPDGGQAILDVVQQLGAMPRFCWALTQTTLPKPSL